MPLLRRFMFTALENVMFTIRCLGSRASFQFGPHPQNCRFISIHPFSDSGQVTASDIKIQILLKRCTIPTTTIVVWGQRGAKGDKNKKNNEFMELTKSHFGT